MILIGKRVEEEDAALLRETVCAVHGENTPDS